MSARIKGSDIKPGTVLEFLGKPHVVETVEPYDCPISERIDRIVRAAGGWGMSIDRDGWYDLATIGGQS